MSRRSHQSSVVQCRWVLWMAVVALTSAAHAESISIAAVVNDDVITTTDLTERRDLIMALNRVEPTAENQQRMTPRILRALIDETLQIQEAKRLSINVSDEEVAKAVAATERGRGQAGGSMLALIQSQGLSKRSMDTQLRTNIAWSRVVQRKLRRNVSISEDEVAREQQSQAADPGVSELRIAGIALPIRKKEQEEKVAGMAKAIGDEISAGASMGSVALKYAKEDIDIAPSKWVAEETLPPALQQVLRTLKAGEVTPPLRTPDGFQLLQLADRRISRPLPDATEVVLKDIRIPAPGTPSKDAVEKWRQQTLEVRANPGSCTDTALGVSAPQAEAKFVRTQLSSMSAEMRSIVTHLGVTEISEPMSTSREIAMVMLCERIEPADAATAGVEKIRQKLFAEKLELEAAKRMRDLKRDAFIDIKGSDAS